MAVIHSYPPNINEINLVLPTNDTNVFSYYPDIYVPSGKELEADLMLHENIHLEQQKAIGVQNWWRKYLIDIHFRLDQELAAFAAQLAYGKEVYPVKTSDQMKQDFAFLLSGKQYQTGLTYQEADTALRRRAREFEKTVV